MAAKTTKFKLDRYLQLVSRFPLIPIESEAQLKRAIAFIDELLDKDRSLEEELYLDVLGQIVEQYEDQAYPEEPVDDATMLAELLSSREITQTSFAKLTDISESTVSAVLSGKRKLTRAQIARISKHLNVPAEVFDFSE